MPQVTEITVHAGRTFNDPHESYANFKPGISIRLTIAENENPEAVAKEWQGKAERLMDAHKAEMLRENDMLHKIANRIEELARLERETNRAESRIAELRTELKGLTPATTETWTPRGGADDGPF